MSETEVISQINHHLLDACRGDDDTLNNDDVIKKDNQGKDGQQSSRHLADHDMFKPALSKSLKSEELAQAHVCFAQELLRSKDYNLALNELCEAIKNCTTTDTLRQIVSTRIVVLFRMNYLHECQSEMNLLKTVCCNECQNKIFGNNLNHFIIDAAQKYHKFVDKFEVGLSCALDETTRKEICHISEKMASHKTDHSSHNAARSCTVPSIGDHLSQEYNYVSNSVDIHNSQDRGRHVIAKKPLQIGDIIAVEDAPTWTLLPGKWDSHCQLCVNLCNRAPLPCLDCPDVVYCSVECLERDTLHRVECGYMSAFKTLPKMVYLAFRTVTMFRGDIVRQSRGEETSVDFQHVASLLTNLEHRTPVDITRRATLAIFLTNITKELDVFKMCESTASTSDNSTTTICRGRDSTICIGDMTICLGGCHKAMDYKTIYSATSSLLLKCLQSYPCNAHEISELQIRPDFRYSANEDIGAGVYPFLSLVNHSCNPNVVRHSVGHVTVLRVLRSIRSGQELLDNYGYHYATHTVAERSKALKSQYYFVCGCVPCVEGPTRWSLFSEVPRSVRFRCPTCKKEVAEGRKKCSLCGRSQAKFIQRIRVLESKVRGIILSFVGGSYHDVDIAPVIEFLSICDSHTTTPFTLFNEGQEVLKQKWNLESNKRELLY